MSVPGKVWRWFRPKLRLVAKVGPALGALLGIKGKTAIGKVLEAAPKAEEIVTVIESAPPPPPPPPVRKTLP